MHSTTVNRYWLTTVLVLGAIARLGYGLARPPQAVGISDPDGYVQLASSFAQTWTLSEQGKPSAHREPAYPILLGLFFKLLGQRYLTVLILNVILGVGSLYLLYEAGRTLFSETEARIASAVAAFYPPFIFYAAQSMRDTWLVFIGLLGILALCWARKKDLAGAYGLAGSINALGPLSNIVFLPFGLIMAPLSAVWISRQGFRRFFRKMAAYLTVFICLYALWPLRNYLELRRCVLGATAGGWANLYVYMVIPQEDGGTPRQREVLDKDPVILESAKLDPISQDRYFFHESVRKIIAEPGRYARLVLWRAVDFWRPWPRPRAYPHSYRLLFWTGLLSDGWIIPLGLAGLWLCWPGAPELSWVFGFMGSVSLVYILIFTIMRYRLPVMPWVILFASVALRRIATGFYKGERRA